MKWFKFYGQDWLTDLKVQQLSTEDRLCYLTLLCLASAADDGGRVRGVTEWSVIGLTHLPNDYFHDRNPQEEATGFLQRLEGMGMIALEARGGNELLGVTYDVTVCNFSKRQEQNLSNAERQKRYRERLKIREKRTQRGAVTQRNDSNARIEENRLDINTSRSLKLAGDIVKKKP